MKPWKFFSIGMPQNQTQNFGCGNLLKHAETPIVIHPFVNRTVGTRNSSDSSAFIANPDLASIRLRTSFTAEITVSTFS